MNRQWGESSADRGKEFLTCARSHSRGLKAIGDRA